jgi:chemotaxis regulatin CheY-phosphate phosphatase CheZ
MGQIIKNHINLVNPANSETLMLLVDWVGGSASRNI